ncbi:MAG: division/cell wall cluster transcriptional repressor MraZ [Pseudomonadales bacterium]|nr:division/cell wall cluster transcriptional repressor MraZ [Pseudomonadales bacterium]MCP5185358.1 division/cell wall cluster transcriptional repressor MraZ [Pseudomonadales bacterium]
MFRGTNPTSVDAKGRLGLPVRLREQIQKVSGTDVVVTIDVEDRCLLLYPQSTWDALQEKLQALANIGSGARLIQRLLIGHATDVQIDGNGRILLPSLLREFANVEKNAILVGQGNKVEIWSEPTWRAQRDLWLTTQKDELARANEAVRDISV